MQIHNHNLNIHYSLLEEVWDKLAELYTEMPAWIGFINDIPHWFGQEDDEKIISASVEASGVQFYAEMPQEEWEVWFKLFKEKASDLLGFDVGEPEEGFEFHTYA